MSAIENVGQVLDINKLDKNQYFNYLRDFDTVMRDIYIRSYFITKNMQEDFGKKTKINGILPILLWSAAKTNHDIIHVKYFILDSSADKKYIDDNLIILFTKWYFRKEHSIKKRQRNLKAKIL